MSVEPPAFKLIMPAQLTVPMLISVPHCGTLLTDRFRAAAAGEAIEKVPDTDWYVEQLYDFATALNIPLIHAVYSRYIVDLNRQLPGEANLYQNAARTTGLVPLTSFGGQPIYKPGCEPDEQEIARRIERYYRPYYQQIDKLLAQLQQRFAIVMLYDGHSILGRVPAIQSEPFVDYMPANRSGTSCPEIFIEQARQIIQSHGASCIANGPFKGGNITRSFHRPDRNILTFQMEISQRIYMDEQSGQKCQPNWSDTVIILRQIIERFSELLLDMNKETR